MPTTLAPEDLLSPLDAGLLEIGMSKSGLPFPPKGWRVIKTWGSGYALNHDNGLRSIIDCALKYDDRWWVHVSVSRAKYTPTHGDMALVKQDFLGERYAYSVWAPQDQHVNIHQHCLHLWSVIDNGVGLVLPEFSEVLPGLGRSI